MPNKIVLKCFCPERPPRGVTDQKVVGSIKASFRGLKNVFPILK